MCNNSGCNNSSCTGQCKTTYQNYPCPQFPPPVGPTGPAGPAGPTGPSGNNAESGSFTQLIAFGPGPKAIATVGKIKMLFITAVVTGPGNTTGSSGITDVSMQNCMYTSGGTAAIDLANAVHVEILGTGWTGNVTTFGPASGFVIDFTAIGLGSDITLQWHAIIE